MERVGLAEAIAVLRDELRCAEEGADPKRPLRVGDVQIEFQVELERSAAVDGGVRFWVVSIGAKASAARTTMHTVRVTLTPETPEGGPRRVGGDVGKRPG